MTSIVNFVRGSALLFSLLLLATIGGGTASSADAQVPSKASFGDKTSFQTSDVGYAVSDDKQAFTISFNSAFEASVDKSPVSTQAFSVVIPVSGQNIDATFTFQGVVLVTEGALATLIININDTNTVMRYRPGFDNSVVVPVRYRAKTASDIRIAIFLLAEHDQAHPNGSASMHFDTIDGNMGSAKAHPGKKR